jgi:hypothetical protein
LLQFGAKSHYHDDAVINVRGNNGLVSPKFYGLFSNAFGIISVKMYNHISNAVSSTFKKV